jgi:hypothetical protein
VKQNHRRFLLIIRTSGSLLLPPNNDTVMLSPRQWTLDMFFYKIITFLILVITSAWAINQPEYESIAAALGALAAVIVVFYIDRKKNSSSTPSQNIEAGGAGIQAGRDANGARVDKK